MGLLGRTKARRITGLIMSIWCNLAADKLWDALRTSNADLAEAFASLARVSKEDPNEYDRQVDELSRRKNTEVRALV